MVVPTNPHSPNEISATISLTPKKKSTIAVKIPKIPGYRKFFIKFSFDALLHDINGPMPISSINISPIGTFTRLKYGGPTSIFSPLRASETIGNIVPTNTENAAPRNARLLNKNALSLDKIESNRFSLLNLSSLSINITNENISIKLINDRKYEPISD